jgi:gliding motility-associated-like protein
MEVIDEFSYTDKMHAPLLADEEGISLERKSFTTETNSIKNWYSASSESGYGTPGYKNSQAKSENVIKPLVTFSPESFSPNSDGYNDEYIIQYQLEKSGYYANISIFDAAGRLVTQLSKNEILGTSGEIIWNGEDETGQRQNLGVYVVVVEIFDLVGNIYRYKDGVVLTSILE